MAFRGERFVLDLDDSDGEDHAPAPSPFSLIGEIRERAPTAAKPPAPAPQPTASSTGFPAHRKRNKVPSFKERRTGQTAAEAPPPPVNTAPPTVQDDKEAIGEENRRHLASMSDDQIQKEREELMSSLDPGLLERFLRRARIDEDEHKEDAPKTEESRDSQATSKPKKSVSFDVPVPTNQPPPKPAAAPPKKASTPLPPRPANDDLPPKQIPTDLHPANQPPSLDPAMIEKFHFPRPEQPMPTLDPSDPNFLSDMRSHYFPEISHDPQALSWLQPPSNDEEDPDSTSPYHPASEAISISPSAIRFSLQGSILPPETSLSMPTTMGLHHHGDDPQAAGYTIPELAILSRSTFPAQRCVAWQVLGRILFRLGKTEFGDRGGQLSEGLWFVIEKEGVVAGMLAEAEGATSMDTTSSAKKKKDEKTEENGTPLASGIGRHASAAAWAVEGVWLWQKSGAGDRGLLKEGQIRSQ